MTRVRHAITALLAVLALVTVPVDGAARALPARPSMPEAASAVSSHPQGGANVVTALVDRGAGPEVVRHEVADEAAARRLLAELRADPDVMAADRPSAFTSHGPDPLLATQWPLERLRAELAWEVTTAADTRIAVLDTGVDRAHPDLADVLADGHDVLDADGDGGTDTSSAGHGTRVAGIAGAEVGNGEGMAGLARGTELVPVRVLDDTGVGDAGNIAQGVIWAADQDVDVINLSLGGLSRDEVLAAAIAYARRQGVVVVASSGNSGDNGNPVIYPAAEPDVIGVGAIGQGDGRSRFSSYGDWLDLVAPGEQMTVTCPLALAAASACDDGYYLYSAGTSFAAPLVAATAALVRARHPRSLPSQVAWRLRATAEDIGQPGFDAETGHGAVDPFAALSEFPDLGCRSDEPGALTRAWDVGRVQTAAAVACTHWPAGGAGEVVLATARDFPDALAGAALAADRDAPLLLTEPLALLTHLEEVLVDLGVERITLAGGREAVGNAVVTALESRGVQVTRIAGADRYETAAELALLTGLSGAEEVLLTSGEGFADAVAAGAFQGADPGTPLLLTRRDALPQATADALADLGPTRVTVVGGPAVVDDAVLAAVEALGPTTVRVSGATRYETSAQVATGLGAEVPLLIASGADFPDALAAGAAAARLEARLLLVPPDELDAADPASAVVDHGPWARLEVVGGPSAVSDPVADRLLELFEE